MTWTNWALIRRLRVTHPILDLVVETADGFRRHLSMRNAAVLTYYGFVSVFPLFMVATSILGMVLRSRPDLREQILETAVAQFPVIGGQIRGESGTLEGSLLAVVLGLLVALWAATRAFAGVQTAFDDVWEVPLSQRANIAVTRLKALGGVGVIGSGIIVATAASSVVGAVDLPDIGRLGTGLATWVLNTGVLMVMIRLLTAARVTWAMAFPGAILAGILFSVLQITGSALISRSLATASDTAGAFATVFALLAWLNLHAIVSILAVELNAARTRQRARESRLQP